MSLPLAGNASNVTLAAADVEIGAVEIKDSTTDTRAVVGATGLQVDVQAANLSKVNGHAISEPAAGVQGVGLTDGTNAVTIAAAGSDNTSNAVNRLDVTANAKGFNGATWDRLRAGVTSLTSILTGFLNALPWAIYNATPSVRTEAQGGPLQADTSGNLNVDEKFAPVAEDNANGVIAVIPKPLAVSTYSWTRFQNLGANATLNVKASAGNVVSAYMTNLSGATRFFQLHNTATTPSGGAVPVYSFQVPVGGNVIVEKTFFGENGMNFATGIAFACSTTETTYTAATATDQSTYLQYK